MSEKTDEVVDSSRGDIDSRTRKSCAHLGSIESAIAILVEFLEDIPQLALLIPQKASVADEQMAYRNWRAI